MTCFCNKCVFPADEELKDIRFRVFELLQYIDKKIMTHDKTYEVQHNNK